MAIQAFNQSTAKKRTELKESPTFLALMVLFLLGLLGIFALSMASCSSHTPPRSQTTVASAGPQQSKASAAQTADSASPPAVQAPDKHALRYLAVGLLAGVIGAGGGGLLGLLFGLPTSASRAAAAAAAVANPERDAAWFNDNTAMEQIADWLTKIIVGLTLTNFQKFADRFYDVSIAISAEMTGFSNAGPVPGGAALASSSILGFIISYIWIRRYLPGELTAARQDMLDRQKIRRDGEEISTAERSGNYQEHPDKGRAVQELTKTFTARFGDALEEPYAFVQPEPNSDDPWKGRFHTDAAVTSTVALNAIVTPIETNPDLFRIQISVDPTTATEPPAKRRGRLYLHPTFPKPIRDIVLDERGAFRIDLIAWGAFTVGLQLETGELHELDLSELPGAPLKFRQR